MKEMIGKIKDVRTCFWRNGCGLDPNDHPLGPSTTCDQCDGTGTIIVRDIYRPIGIKINSGDER